MNTYEHWTKAQLIQRVNELEKENLDAENTCVATLQKMDCFMSAQEEIYAIDAAGYLVYANRLTIEHYQLPDPYRQYGIWNFSQYVAEHTWPALARELREKNMKRLESYHLFPDGHSVLFEVTLYRLAGQESGDMLLCFARDMSGSLQNQRKINFVNLLMDTILSNIFVAICVKEVFDNFKYIYFNKAAEKFTGVEAGSILGKTDFALFPDPRRAHEVRTEDFSTMKNGRTDRVRVEYERPDGELRIVNVTRLLIKNPDEGASPLLLVMLSDITEQYQNELELIKVQEADKMKNAFIANMSHEIRTPLNAIVGFSGLLAETENASERQEYLSIINKNSDLLLQLINDILDFSKIESGTLDYRLAEVDLKNVCHAVYISQALKMTSDVALLFNADALPSVRLHTDARRIEQVLLNLLSNAIKCTSQGFVMLSYEIEGDFVRVSVTDTGVGIAKEKQERIFERFVKLDEFKQGTGLGLSISKMIVERLGGRIGVRSQVGAGSTFWFTLPMRKEELAPAFPASDRAASSPIAPEQALPGQYTVLVAEDVLENYLLLQAILKKQYHLLYAVNGREAVELFRKYGPDLVLMDIKMPEMNGFEAVREIRKLSKEVPVIALTAFAYEKEKEEAMQCEFTDYLVKPVDIPLLKQKIKYYLTT